MTTSRCSLGSRINVPTSCHLELKSLRTTCATNVLKRHRKWNVADINHEHASSHRWNAIVDWVVTKRVTHKCKSLFIICNCASQGIYRIKRAWRSFHIDNYPTLQVNQVADYTHRLSRLRYARITWFYMTLKLDWHQDATVNYWYHTKKDYSVHYLR